MAKLSVKEIINASIYKLSGMKRNELRSAYSKLAKKMDKVIEQFSKHGRLDELDKSITKKRKNANKLTNEELVKSIGDYSNFFLSKNNSYSKWSKKYRSDKAKYRDLMGVKRVSDAEFDEYREYLKDMYEEHKNDMEPSDLYNESNDIWLLSKRLNLNPYQFSDNLEKWSKRLEKLNENISDNDIISGDELELEVYSDSFKKVASWLKEED